MLLCTSTTVILVDNGRYPDMYREYLVAVPFLGESGIALKSRMFNLNQLA